MSRKKKRMPVSQALLRFFIAILTIALFLGAAFFFLRLGRDDGPRPYIRTGEVLPDEQTISPTVMTPSPEPAVTGYDITTPSPEPAPTPGRTLLPDPTPIPTRIPETLLSKGIDQVKIPDPAPDGSVGISHCFVSEANGCAVMELAGWGYAQLEWFDGSDCETYLVVTADSGKQVAYQAANEQGISGRNHVGAVCREPSAADWHVFVDVSGYESGRYRISLVLRYKNGKKNEMRHYEFPIPDTFTVYDGEILIPVTETGVLGKEE